MIYAPRGGCCTPLPYEAAIWLLEEEEEITGGRIAVGGQVRHSRMIHMLRRDGLSSLYVVQLGGLDVSESLHKVHKTALPFLPHAL